MTAKKTFSPESVAAPASSEGQPKHRIHITRIIPMHDLVLLVAFRDKELNMNDVRFLVNRIDGLQPRSEPEQFKVFLLTNQQCITDWENEIGSAELEPGEDAPEVTLHIPEDLFQELSEICNVLDVAIPQLIRAMLRFCVDPDTQDAAAQWSGLVYGPLGALAERHNEENGQQSSYQTPDM